MASDRSGDRRGPDRALSHHILPSAATMVGICPTLIGLVKLTEANGDLVRKADECLALITIVFAVSALASYFSLRDRRGRTHSEWLERVADAMFAVGLVGLAAVTVLFAYEWL